MGGGVDMPLEWQLKEEEGGRLFSGPDSLGRAYCHCVSQMSATTPDNVSFKCLIMRNIKSKQKPKAYNKPYVL